MAAASSTRKKMQENNSEHWSPSALTSESGTFMVVYLLSELLRERENDVPLSGKRCVTGFVTYFILTASRLCAFHQLTLFFQSFRFLRLFPVL